MSEADAAKRGVLTMWTIYERPKDHPGGFIARRFEVGGAPGPKATDDTLKGELEGLRKTFWTAGMMRLTRQEGDEPQIVESWL